MLMKPDKKKSIASLIIGSSAPQEGASEMPGQEEEPQGDMGLESAAEEIMSAVKSGDAKGLVDALKSFMDMCESSEPEQEEPPQ